MKPQIKNLEIFINEVERAFHELISLVNRVPETIKFQTFLNEKPISNIRDIYANIFGWQKMLIGWYEAGRNNSLPDLPAKGYTWKMTGILDLKIWTRYQDTPFYSCETYLQSLFQRIISILKETTDTEMFKKKQFRWTEKRNMFHYFKMFTIDLYEKYVQVLKRGIKKNKIELREKSDDVLEVPSFDEIITTETKVVGYDAPHEEKGLSLDDIIKVMDMDNKNLYEQNAGDEQKVVDTLEENAPSPEMSGAVIEQKNDDNETI